MRVNNECLSKKKRYFYFFFLFSCNFRTITLSFKKKLSPWHRGKCHSNPGVSSHFGALWQRMCSKKITGYEKKSQFFTVVWKVKSEFFLGLLLCCAFYFLRVLWSIKNVLLELCDIWYNRHCEVFHKSREVEHFVKTFYRKCYFFHVLLFTMTECFCSVLDCNERDHFQNNNSE